MTTTYELDDIDNSIPTLIIGLSTAKKIYGDKLDILNKKIDKNIFWTYSKLEKRVDYETDMFKFYQFVLNKLNNDVKYIYFNLLTSKLGKIKSFINFIRNSERKIIYIMDDYLYIGYKRKVIGMSLIDVDYLEIDRKKVINIFKKNNKNVILTNDNFLSHRMKDLINNNSILIPYLYEMKYTEDKE